MTAQQNASNTRVELADAIFFVDVLVGPVARLRFAVDGLIEPDPVVAGSRRTPVGDPLVDLVMSWLRTHAPGGATVVHLGAGEGVLAKTLSAFGHRTLATDPSERARQLLRLSEEHSLATDSRMVVAEPPSEDVGGWIATHLGALGWARPQVIVETDGGDIPIAGALTTVDPSVATLVVLDLDDGAIAEIDGLERWTETTADADFEVLVASPSEVGALRTWAVGEPMPWPRTRMVLTNRVDFGWTVGPPMNDADRRAVLVRQAAADDADVRRIAARQLAGLVERRGIDALHPEFRQAYSTLRRDVDESVRAAAEGVA